MKPKQLLLIGLLIISASCEINIKKPAAENQTSSKTKIRNGVQFEAKGVNVEQAFLTNEEGELVSDENLTEVNKKLKLNLVVNGWKDDKGMVALDADEKVYTSEGELIMDEKDLFTQSGLTSVSAADAKFVKLSVSISMVSKLYEFYKVDFKVWNKNFDQQITGSYKFNLK